MSYLSTLNFPNRTEIASLAEKFSLDTSEQDSGQRQNWLCAEYMLTQKRMIECQISALHDRQAGVIA